METVVSCPVCGKQDSLDSKFDAWARHRVVGVDSKGNLELSRDFDTQVFDYHEIECSNCGAKFGDREIASHLRQASDNTNQ